jgi:homoserine dehydrogenase
MKEIGIGLLGFGTVGAGVVKGMQANGDIMAERLGVRPVLRGIADLDTETDRGVEVDPDLLTADAAALVDDPGVEVVVELIGGTGVARDLVKRALALKKPVVTANKALLAEHGADLFALAEAQQTDIYFEASVGGGMPIIRALREGLVANRVDSIYGILNGTCNYILTRMEREGLPFDQVLSEAQALGYAEADPGLDIDGVDTAHKAVILASLAHGQNVPMAACHVEGIRSLAEIDIRYALDYALDFGYRIKLLAVIKEADGKVEVRVHPTLVPLDHVLASVHGVYNAVMVHGDFADDTLYYGRGAGQEPTASAVLGDICDVVRNLVSGSPHRLPAVAKAASPAEIRPMEDVETRYYIRLAVADEPGIVASFSKVLGNHGISIASVLQKEVGETGELVPVVILTHRVVEHELTAAVAEIDAGGITGAPTVWYRIEE